MYSHVQFNDRKHFGIILTGIYMYMYNLYYYGTENVKHWAMKNTMLHVPWKQSKLVQLCSHYKS